MDIPERDIEILHLVGTAADSLGLDAYAVGGYVRDCLLQRHSKDIDFVTVGSGIELARAVSKRLGRDARLAVFRQFRHGARNLPRPGAGIRRRTQGELQPRLAQARG